MSCLRPWPLCLVILFVSDKQALLTHALFACYADIVNMSSSCTNDLNAQNIHNSMWNDWSTLKPLWINVGLLIGSGTLLAIAVLESTCHYDVRAIVTRKGGVLLYVQAWVYTTLNSIVLGPPVYAFVAMYCLHPNRFDAAAEDFDISEGHIRAWSTSNIGIWQSAQALMCQMLSLVGMLMVHSSGYWMAHRAMHTKHLFWAHRFHHHFNKNVTACIAMAVSPVEYCMAYMAPFVVGAILLQPDKIVLTTSACVVSLFNILIHTDACRRIQYPWFWVSTEKHLKHHRQSGGNYAAPTFDVDVLYKLFVRV